jgi:ribosomal subunit interface protein
MQTRITARHFKAHDSLIDYTEAALEKLNHFYTGIVKAEVIFSFEKEPKDGKITEITLSGRGIVITAIGKSDEYTKSVDSAIEKAAGQIKRYKEKIQEKDNKAVRKVRDKE